MDSAEAQSRHSRNGSLRTALTILGIAGCAVCIALLVKGLYPVDLPLTKNPDFIDNVFDNRGVVWAARLLLVSAAAVLAFGGVFIVVSAAIRMKNGEWLRRAGPFEISEPAVSEVEGQVNFWRTAALAREEEVAELTEHMDESDELIAGLHALLAQERNGHE
ncbi:MAG TPA: hypothetical protein VFY75_04470 [Solirubrobacterales bacterium]|nr:hypothetical protein [Solirubrobacterales bacterium]